MGCYRGRDGSLPTCRCRAWPNWVGEQPLINPEQQFEYRSGTTIATPVGTMRGTYQMMAVDGARFDAPIPEFVLSVPRVLH